MTDPTPIGAVAAELAIRQNVRPNGSPCPEHLGEDSRWCRWCEARHAAADARAESRRRAAELCDEWFPARYTNATADHPAVIAWTERATADQRSPSLLLTGPCGTGKTHQAYGALRMVVAAKGWPWRAVTAADLLGELRPSVNGEPERVLAVYRDVRVLLLDDLGLPKGSQWTEEAMHRLVNHRYNAVLPTIITTNLPPARLAESVGERIASRLAEMCDVVALTGADRRKGSQR